MPTKSRDCVKKLLLLTCNAPTLRNERHGGNKKKNWRLCCCVEHQTTLGSQRAPCDRKGRLNQNPRLRFMNQNPRFRLPLFMGMEAQGNPNLFSMHPLCIVLACLAQSCSRSHNHVVDVDTRQTAKTHPFELRLCIQAPPIH